ncbi:MAG: aminotransferase class V-fold PLP-dependent enzyme [Cyclobacteriaceae bacterium]
MINWEEIRSRYPLIEKGGYFNTASFGAISQSTIDIATKKHEEHMLSGNENYNTWVQELVQLKVELGQYINTDNRNITFFSDVSNGINKVSDVLSGELEVTLIREDFPSVTLPWITRGYKIKWIDYEEFTVDYLGAIEKSLKAGSKILCLSWVFYNHGFRIEEDKVGELCKQYDCYFILDATQGLGAYQINVKQASIDFMISSCFKWFMAGYGLAISHVADSILELRTSQSGWNMLKDSSGSIEDRSNYAKDASVFEVGHSKFQNISVLYNSFSEMKSIGLPEISNRTTQLSLTLAKALKESNFEVISFNDSAPSGMVSIKSNNKILEKIKEHGISCTPRKDYIRFAVYFYNNEDDISSLINSLKN